jgi:glutathione S-transferase
VYVSPLSSCSVPPNTDVPASQAEIALAHAKADYKRFEIDLQNKPEWYAPKVNPASKVPAVAYGGPDVAPDQPSPESTKIAESLYAFF